MKAGSEVKPSMLKRPLMIMLIVLSVYCLSYVGVRLSHILVHQWFYFDGNDGSGVFNPGGWEHRIGVGRYFDREWFDGAYIPGAKEVILRGVYYPFVISEGWFWELKEMIE